MTKVSRYLTSLREQASLSRKQIKALLSHSGEKGRAFEHIVRGIVRSVLPKRFSIGSGFAATSEDEESAQLDIVIYDEQLNAPLSLIGDIGVFPIECIYATIEVKSWLDGDEIERAAKSIGKMRTFRNKRYVQEFVPDVGPDGRPFLRRANLDDRQDDYVIDDLSPRSYLFAFNTKSSLETLTEQLRVNSRKHGAFFHGVIVLEQGWFIKQIASDRDNFRTETFEPSDGDALKSFVVKLSKDIITYPMYAANMRRYLDPA